MNFVRRRIRNALLLVLTIVLAWCVFRIIDYSLHTHQYYSGWVVAAAILFLLLFYVKKKLSVIPLGSTSGWAQWHYYTGLFMVAAFAMHVEFAVPDGYVERIMTTLLAVVVFVGVAGGIINRVFARRLAFLDEEIVYERIREFSRTLRDRLEKELSACVEEAESTTLAEYYKEHLADYFAGQHDFFAHLIGNRRPHLTRLNDLELQFRYLNKRESAFAMKLADYIEQKNTLDAHYALQGVLKYWGILHAPIGFVLLVMVVVHVVLVYAFRGAL